MTDKQKEQISQLRMSGYGYTRISQMMGISVNTIKSYCRRHCSEKPVVAVPITVEGEKHVCLNCGKDVQQNPGRKEKKFCSDHCRNIWWNAHLDQVKRKANYEYICPHCKKKFVVYGNAHRKYCSHACYIEDRFGGAV